ncbi:MULTISPECIES: type II toxin-antitoxin system VapC family toxin [unclassified Rhizobium]|uniref:type II toxin-antitoxin system VapC family toxin n=1 Tax=unclassified Rhizobium TaxID=2613769 RepID=UPI001AD97458|nr:MULTISPECIES: type II toxin-antitoxin system VapC family toxin [unclassified Rhizobium]MBO9101283.1 type II toxin-antitoxin system VapC family toxin [Rhizobium sp. L58/93]MBO9166780.1 type II toxin-antitoxin system VapC family toxin [Rhizobium sp. L245/93]MBO9182737.1 type II toxin-antitoxin system VapC family toxin [Rhizobium sp. E27B/91]QXZ86421.1 type II toxin-antitoxin system VapC family toxin [Rhizobium sp. K1/93]QXZ92124.1 type II toxin-antitoxin system VapC family toxin [Rhizobium sp
MIALDTSAIVATALGEPEAELFYALMSREEILVGWPTLLEARMVLAGKHFPGAAAVIAQLVALPNVTAVAFGERHYHAAELAFERFGKGRHPASLNMGDCFSYAVSAIAKAPLLCKGRDFSQSDLKLHPASSMA